MHRSDAVTLQKPRSTRGLLSSDEEYTRRKFDLISLRQKKFVLNRAATKSTCIKNTKHWLNNLFLKRSTEPYINYVKPQLKNI